MNAYRPSRDLRRLYTSCYVRTEQRTQNWIYNRSNST